MQRSSARIICTPLMNGFCAQIGILTGGVVGRFFPVSEKLISDSILVLYPAALHTAVNGWCRARMAST